MSAIQIGNDVFEYDLQGGDDAEVLLFSNSLGTSLALWDEQASYFSSRYRVLRYDTRGHGLSAKSPGPYTIEQLGTDVIRLADALGIEKFSFCGISMGGLIGQWLGVHAPGRINKLALCNTAALLGTRQAWLERAALVRGQGMEPVAQATPARWFTPSYLEKHGEQAQRYLNMLRQTDVEGYASCCEAIGNADMREWLSQVQAPTLILTGTHDPVTTPADADDMARRIARNTRIDVDASHISNVEAAGQFNQALERHLAQS
ncbi:MAG: 3-oxoadipate enol-lactonase [Pusillimonas sp.]